MNALNLLNAMAPFFGMIAWGFLALALLFVPGLFPSFAHRFYPQRPGVLHRAAAPVIFALLSIACFSGAGLPVLALVVVAGIVQSGMNRTRRQKAPTE